MARRVRSLVALSFGTAGAAVVLVVLLLSDLFAEMWRIRELERLPTKEAWSAAARLESGSALGQKAAERWYLRAFEERKDEIALRALARLRSPRAGAILVSLLEESLDRGKGAFPPCFIADRLREIGVAASLAKPELVKLLIRSRRGILTSADPAWPDMHRSAVAALESVLGERGMAAGILRNELDDPSWRIRLEAVTELGELGPDAALAIDSLMARLEDPQPSIREGAARVLGSLGPAARAALPALGRARQDGDPSVEAAARTAILWIAYPEFARRELEGE